MSPELDKIAVRRRMLQTLRRLDPDHREALSHDLRSRLSTCEPLRAARTILAFAPLSSEPMIDELLDAWRAEGRTVLLPRTLDAPGAMDLVELNPEHDIDGRTALIAVDCITAAVESMQAETDLSQMPPDPGQACTRTPPA